MKILSGIIFGVFITTMATSARAETLELPWTANASSVQAVLKASLYNTLRSEENSYFKWVKGDYRTVSVEDKNNKITCQERTAEKLQVQEYHCIFESKPTESRTGKLTFPWTANTVSVQAILKYSLYTTMKSDEISASQWVKGDDKRVLMEDENTKIVCEEHPAGTLQVQNYRCEIIMDRDTFTSISLPIEEEPQFRY